MVSVGKLYGNLPNIRVQKCLIASKLSSVELDFTEGFKMSQDNKSEEYLKKFPLGQVPAFESNDGLLLTESNAIVFHLAKLQEGAPLLGNNVNDQSKIVQLSFFVETQILPPCVQIYIPVFFFTETTIGIENASYEKLDQALAYLDNYVGDRKYLIGNQVSVADIIVAGAVYYPLAKLLGNDERAQYQKLVHWFKNIVEIPEFKQVLGDIEYNATKQSINNKPKSA